MPDLTGGMGGGLSGLPPIPGLLLLTGAILLAGLARGFTGFGTALIFMPVATHVVPMPVAMVALTLTDMVSWPVIVPKALKQADRREVLILTLAAVVATPLGVLLLGLVEEGALRWIVSGLVLATLLALISGWRYRGRVTTAGVVAIGAAAGLLGGSTGLAGPPVILFYLAGAAAAAVVVRANTILFLALIDIAILANLFLQGRVSSEALWLGALLVLPYAVAMLGGQALFRPGRERVFRLLAYSFIGLSALAGLPLWDA